MLFEGYSMGPGLSDRERFKSMFSLPPAEAMA